MIASVQHSVELLYKCHDSDAILEKACSHFVKIWTPKLDAQHVHML